MDNTAVTVGSVIAASIIIFVMFVFLAVVIAIKKHRNQIPIAQNSFKETRYQTFAVFYVYNYVEDVLQLLYKSVMIMLLFTHSVLIITFFYTVSGI